MRSLATSLLVVLAAVSVSGLPKYYQDTLYKPGGLDHLDATGDESKWGKMVRWILTGKSNIPNDKKDYLKGKGGPGGPDGRRGPGDVPLDTVIKPNGRIKTVGPFGPISLDGSVQPTVGVNPDGSIHQIGTDVVVKPNGRLKPTVVAIDRGLPLPPPGPVNPNLLAPGPVGLDTVIKPNGRIKTVGPFGPITLDGSVQPSVGVNPDGSIHQIGTDVVVKPNGRLKPTAVAIDRGLPLPPPGPVNPNLLPPGPVGLDRVVKPNGRVKTVGPYGPISLDGSVQPTVGVNPDGSIHQIGTDVVVKPNGRIKPVAELINNGVDIRPLGPVNPDLLRDGPGGPLSPGGPESDLLPLPNGPGNGFGTGVHGNLGPLDRVIKPNGRVKTVGAYGPISLDGSVQPTVGVNPDGSIHQIGTDVVVKPDGRIKPVAALVNHRRPLGPVNPDLIVHPDGSVKPGNGLARAADPFGGAGPVGNPVPGPGPYGYGNPGNYDKEWYERYEYGFRHRRRNAYPYVF